MLYVIAEAEDRRLTCEKRWIFWIVVPISATAGVMIPLFLNIRFKRKIEVKIQLKAFDWLGLVLFMASSTSFLIAITLVSSILDGHSTDANERT